MTHTFATFVRERTEGITNNVDHLVRALVAQGIDARLDCPEVSLADLNRRSTQIFGGWKARGRVLAALDDPLVEAIHYHVAIPPMALFARLARPFRRQKNLVVHFWNAHYSPGKSHAPVPALERLSHALLNGRAAARIAKGNFAAAVVSSEYQASQLRTLGLRAPVHVIPNGVDTMRFRPGSAEERLDARRSLGLEGDPLIAYVGHASPWKGLSTLVEALPAVFGEAPGARAALAVTSYGNGRAAIARRVRELGLEGRVRFLDVVDVPTFLQAADVAVVPAVSHVGTACHPNVVLEQMSAGLPVVASRVGSIPEAIHDGRTGLLARPANAEDLAAKLALLATDRALARRLGEAARRDARERFDWSIAAKRMSDLYGTLAQGSVTARASVLHGESSLYQKP